MCSINVHKASTNEGRFGTWWIWKAIRLSRQRAEHASKCCAAGVFGSRVYARLTVTVTCENVKATNKIVDRLIHWGQSARYTLTDTDVSAGDVRVGQCTRARTNDPATGARSVKLSSRRLFSFISVPLHSHSLSIDTRSPSSFTLSLAHPHSTSIRHSVNLYLARGLHRMSRNTVVGLGGIDKMISASAA